VIQDEKSSAVKLSFLMRSFQPYAALRSGRKLLNIRIVSAELVPPEELFV
jgi:hypothetical protein